MVKKKTDNLGMKMAKKIAEYQIEGYGKKDPPLCSFIFYQPNRPKRLRKDK